MSQGVVPPDRTAPGQLMVVAAPALLVSPDQGLEHMQQQQWAWVPRGNTDRTSKGEGIVHILAVPSFVDRGSIRMLKG